MDHDAKKLEMFLRIINSASEKAFLAVVESFAQEIGHPEIRGIPVRQFFFQERDKWLEEEISDLADTDMAQASEIRLILEKWRQRRGRIQ